MVLSFISLNKFKNGKYFIRFLNYKNISMLLKIPKKGREIDWDTRNLNKIFIAHKVCADASIYLALEKYESI